MKATRQLAAVGATVAALAAGLAVGAPQASAAPDRLDKLSATVTLDRTIPNTCVLKWSASNLKLSTSYQVILLHGTRDETTYPNWINLSTYDLMVYDSATSSERGTIRDSRTFSASTAGTYTNFTLTLWDLTGSGTTPTARDISVTNRCT